MPVNECAVGIWLPRPDVQGIERRQAEAIGAFKVVKELSHKLGRALPWMSFVPGISQYQKICTDQLKVTVGPWFVNHDLGPGGIDDAAADKGHIHVVKAHRA